VTKPERKPTGLKQLEFPGFRAGPCGLTATKTLSKTEWNRAGRLIAAIEGRLMWYVGDWLMAGEATGYLERGKLDDACRQFGIAYDTAKQAVRVCKAYDQRCRRIHLSFGHHQLVANRDDAEELLEWADGKTVRELRDEKQRRDSARNQQDVPDGKYSVIYADPPWKYGDERDQETGGAAAQYPLMSIAELCELPVPRLAADNCALFMWVTVPLCSEAVQLLPDWGFEYKTHLCWDKCRPYYGNYSHVQHELLWICTRGSMVPQAKSELPKSLVRVKRGKHSEKPVEFYEIIERMFPKAKLIELFARQRRKGWDAWGNELPASTSGR
jgi:N6-adenosine-specific RNA methylase IME4